MERTNDVQCGFPYASKMICYIAIDHNGTISQIEHRKQAKLNAAAQAADGEIKLYAAWPGDWKTNLFEVDGNEMLDAILRA